MSSSPARRRILLGGAVAVVVLAVLAGVSLLGGSPDRPGPGPTSSDPVARARLDVPRRDPADPLARGPVDAPVVVALWSDFQCPFCRLYAQRIAPALDARYDDVMLNYQTTSFHDALYAGQPAENAGAVTDASLAATADRLGLDPARFRADYADPAIAQAVADDQRLGASLGVRGVPSFVIDDRLVFGAQPAATFEQVIDAALAARAGR